MVAPLDPSHSKDSHAMRLDRRQSLRSFGATALALAIGGVATIASPDAEAAKRRASGPSSAAGPRRAKSGRNTWTFHRGSEEMTNDRDRRLARECRNLPNAGACAGFGR